MALPLPLDRIVLSMSGSASGALNSGSKPGVGWAPGVSDVSESTPLSLEQFNGRLNTSSNVHKTACFLCVFCLSYVTGTTARTIADVWLRRNKKHAGRAAVPALRRRPRGCLSEDERLLSRSSVLSTSRQDAGAASDVGGQLRFGDLYAVLPRRQPRHVRSQRVRAVVVRGRAGFRRAA